MFAAFFKRRRHQRFHWVPATDPARPQLSASLTAIGTN